VNIETPFIDWNGGAHGALTLVLVLHLRL
jgi:hypothetical protein